MESKTVYRVLRKISDWTLKFYSEVYVEGEENVPPDGPVILASCHHNEIIDIATLSVTIPYHRPVCYWAKSTMFKNNITRSILLSSGSIPVNRNPNNSRVPDDNEGHSTSPEPSSNNTIHQSLFLETFRALDAGEVVGVFPEGTSYTEPQIAQVKDGAAWAALEYCKWQRENEDSKAGPGGRSSASLVLIPVGIVYTDKAQYQSRLCVSWGKPIDMKPYVSAYLSETTEDTRTVIKDLTSEIERRLRELTINAPDWDTWYAASVLMNIFWKDEENIPLGQYATVRQTYIDSLSKPQPAAKRAALLKYYSLLHYTNISHSALDSVFPADSIPTRLQALSGFLCQLAITVLHPRFVLFIPPLLLHIPAYLLGYFGGRFLASPLEEETKAQFKAVCGGLGFGAASGFLGNKFAGLLASSSNSDGTLVDRIGWWVFGSNDSAGLWHSLRQNLGTLAVMYGTTWVLSWWHNALVTSNYKQFKRLLASFKVLVGLLSPFSRDLSVSELDYYCRPPPAYVNPFIKRRDQLSSVHDVSSNSSFSRTPSSTPSDTDGSKVANVSPRRSSYTLVRHLLQARLEATLAAREVSSAMSHSVDS